MKTLKTRFSMEFKYILKSFGFSNLTDYWCTVDKAYLLKMPDVMFAISVLGILIERYTGMQIAVIVAFCVLICAETYTGLKVAFKVKNESFKSRKFGRMILKIGTYLFILSLINVFAKNMDVPDVWGMSLNPFVWLYHSVFVAIIFQLLVSYFENLGLLGYAESKTIAGFILKKFNKIFEFDGRKDNDY